MKVQIEKLLARIPETERSIRTRIIDFHNRYTPEQHQEFRAAIGAVLQTASAGVPWLREAMIAFEALDHVATVAESVATRNGDHPGVTVETDIVTSDSVSFEQASGA
jgi:hypothetical protein